MPGRRYSFEVNRVSTAPPAVLFRLETDGPGWASWAGPLIPRSSWAEHGDNGGVGAVRDLGPLPGMVRERTLEYEPDRRHVYTLDSPSPMRDYRAEVCFRPNSRGGTDLRWTGAFTERVPGTGRLLRPLLHGMIRTLSARLVKAAESRG